MTIDLYQVVTDRILAQLEKGTAPWVKPWGNGECHIPHNAHSGRAYRGINAWLLDAPVGSTGNGWMTYNQAKSVGGQVRKGEKGSMIVFFKMMTLDATQSRTGTEKTFPLLRYFTVFHTSQIDNLPVKYLPKAPVVNPVTVRNAVADAIMTIATVVHGGDRAFYRPADDQIYMPVIESFKSADDYHGTALHELTHWTGSDKRCDRTFGKRFGDDAYAVEELTAELGAAYLCAHAGVNGQLQHANYLQSWINVLKADKRAIISVASAAQKAADFVLKAAGMAPADDVEEIAEAA